LHTHILHRIIQVEPLLIFIRIGKATSGKKASIQKEYCNEV
jgi:hypothetical protein